jgi:DNA-binding CsgD family transcriptional regulator
MIDKDLYIQFLESLIKTKQQPTKLTSVKIRTRKPRYIWTDEERERLLMLHSQGIKTREIARIMGLRSSQVENQIYSLLRRNRVA